MNVGTKCHDNQSSSCWDNSVWILDCRCHHWSLAARMSTFKLNTEKEQQCVFKRGPSCCENCVRHKPRYKQVPCFCLIKLSVHSLPACCDDVNFHIQLKCWKSPEPMNTDYEPEVGVLIRDVHVSWSQKTSTHSWLHRWPRSMAPLQESLNNRDEIILCSPHYSPVLHATFSVLSWTLYHPAVTFLNCQHYNWG